MAFHLLLFRNQNSIAIDPASLWADTSGTDTPSFDTATRKKIARALQQTDPTLDSVTTDDDRSLGVSSSQGIGIDWHIGANRIVAEAQVAGVKPADAEAVFARLLACLVRLRDQFGVSIWSPEVGRLVDPVDDHETLARAWLHHCQAASKSHLEAARSDGALSMIAALLLLGLLLAATATPNPAQPVVGLAIAIVLAFALIVAIARRVRR